MEGGDARVRDNRRRASVIPKQDFGVKTCTDWIGICGVEPRPDGAPRRRRATESGGLNCVDVRGLADATGIDFDRCCLGSTAVHTLDITPVYLPACIHPDRPLPYDPDHAAGLWKLVGGERTGTFE